MNLYFNTISPQLKSGLDKLFSADVFDCFTLVGGTALSLYRGHRHSIDIDLFTDIEYQTMPRQEIKTALRELFPYVKYLESLDDNSLVYSVFCGESKDDCFKLDLCYTEKFLYSPIEIQSLRIADIKDIAAIKIAAIDNSLRMKDFWDIHELLDVMPLSKMIEYAEKRDPYGIDIANVIDKIKNIRNLPIENLDITSLKGIYWEFVLEDLEEAAKTLSR